MRYVAAAAANVVRKPQFIAMKIASVAPTTDNAPFIPHAHATRSGARRLRSRRPVGIGTPRTTPIGNSRTMEIAIRTAREKGMAHATIGVAIATSRSAIAATDALAVEPARGRHSSGTRRRHE